MTYIIYFHIVMACLSMTLADSPPNGKVNAVKYVFKYLLLWPMYLGSYIRQVEQAGRSVELAKVPTLHKKE